MESQDRALIPQGEALAARFTGISGWFPSFSYERDSSEAGYRSRCSVIDLGWCWADMADQNLWRRLFLTFHSEHELTIQSDNIALFDEALTSD